MRKLIITGIITVLSVLTWTCYIQYDTKKFIEELPQEPPTKQHVDGNKKDSRDTLRDGDIETTQTKHENTSIFSSEKKQEDSAQPNESGADTGREVDASVLGQTPSDNGISPELIKVFKEIQPIYKEMEEIVSKIAPLNRQMQKTRVLKQAIWSELETVKDPDEGKKLSEELESLTQLEQEAGSKMLKLQGKLIPSENKLKRILSEYGFRSQREFETNHIETYKTWVSEQ